MKLYFTTVLLLTLSLVPVTNNKHEYYVSVTTVEYVEEQESLQMISQIFIDDFENALRQRYDDSVLLNTTEESKLVDELMARYLASKLNVWINEEEMAFQFIGKEYKDDIVYCYLEIKGVESLKSIRLKNSLLFEVFETQQNIMRLKAFDTNKSFLLVPNNNECMLNFD